MPRPDWLGVAGVVALALAVRLAVLDEIQGVAFVAHPVSDARSYLAWAREIAGGDWLGHGVFYQAPLYPYGLALGLRLVGDDPFALRVLQAALGAAACGLVAWAGRAFFSPGAGLLAGLLLAFYPPAIFYDLLIQKDGLALFWTALLLACLGSAQRRPGAARWLLSGGVLGLLALTRENALLLAPLLLAWLLVRFAERPLAARAAWAACLAAGAALALLPVGVRNRVVGGEFALTTAQLGPNFFIGNSPGAVGVYVPLREGRGEPRYERSDATQIAEAELGRALTPREVSHYWVRRSWSFIRGEPAAWLRLTGRKLALVVNRYEIPDTEDLRFYALRAPVLRALSGALHFGVLFPLAVAGMVAPGPRRRDAALLHVVWLGVALGVAAFYVMGRYRHPMSAVLALFAARGLLEGYRALRRRQLRRLLLPAGAAAAAALLANWPVISRAEAQRQLAVSYSNAGEALFEAGRLAPALESYVSAASLAPDYASPRLGIAKVLAATGPLEEAQRAFRAARALAPAAAQLELEFAEVLARRGERELALPHLQRALELSPGDPEARRLLERLGAAR